MYNHLFVHPYLEAHNGKDDNSCEDGGGTVGQRHNVGISGTLNNVQVFDSWLGVKSTHKIFILSLLFV